jgi:hypothetical protein
MTLQELKGTTLEKGFTKIQLDRPGSQPVSLKDWRGVSTNIAGGPGDANFAMVTYELIENRVRVRKALQRGETWYVLS